MLLYYFDDLSNQLSQLNCGFSTTRKTGKKAERDAFERGKPSRDLDLLTPFARLDLESSVSKAKYAER